VACSCGLRCTVPRRRHKPARLQRVRPSTTGRRPTPSPMTGAAVRSGLMRRTPDAVRSTKPRRDPHPRDAVKPPANLRTGPPPKPQHQPRKLLIPQGGHASKNLPETWPRRDSVCAGGKKIIFSHFRRRNEPATSHSTSRPDAGPLTTVNVIAGTIPARNERGSGVPSQMGHSRGRPPGLSFSSSCLCRFFVRADGHFRSAPRPDNG